MDTQRQKLEPDEDLQSRRPYRLPIVLGVVALELMLMGAFLFFSASASSRQVSDQTAYLQGTGPEITLTKLTNGPGGIPQDGPTILAGNVVTWTYTVTNTGNTDLTNVNIVDDNGTPADIADDVPVCTGITALVIGASGNCIVTGTAVTGAYANIAIVQADTAGQPPGSVTDNDASSYFGAVPSISLTKFTNGVDANTAPGPTIIVGATVNWTYVVNNTGNVNLSTIVVSDNRGVTITCPQNTLAPNESMTCTASAAALAGQYTNIGSVSAQPPVGPAVTDTDPSNYFGIVATSSATAPFTPTVTGTLPTATATGTITPNPIITISVSPSQATVNQSLTFTVRITNPGTAPAFNATVADTFPNYIDVISVTYGQGTATKSTHSVSVALGTVMPGDSITVTISTKVNSSLTFTTTTSNIVTLTYNSSVTRTASVAYSVIASNVLPGTGELPLPGETLVNTGNTKNASQFFLWITVMVGSVISAWSWTYRRKSVALISLAAVVVILTAVACSTGDQTQPTTAFIIPASETPTPTLMPFMPAYLFSTPEVYPTLPNFPIPSPSAIATSGPNGDETDTSPVVRIVIPALEIDAIVRYVPFEGITWTIEGLRDEVAWLGNSSWPGLGSNTVLAGHVTVRGLGNGPFRYLEDLAVGDQVVIYTEKKSYTYSVRDQVIVEDTAMDVTAATTSSQLTLITCTGWDTELALYRFRRVVFADLVNVEPVDRQVGRP